MMRISSSFWKFGAVLVLAAALVACGSGKDRSAQGGQLAPSEEQVLRLRISGEPKSIDPHQANFTPEISIAKQLFSALFRYDENLQVVPDMALELPTTENGGISRDGRTYTIKLRKDLKWSDGQALTAADIEYSFKRMLDPKLAAPYSGNFAAITGARDYSTALGTKAAPKSPTDADLAALRDAVGVVAKDERTVVFTLNSPSASFLNQLSLWAAAPVRTDIVERYGDTWTEAANIVGNGPFVLTEWLHDDHLTLAPNANWHLGKAILSRVTISVIEDEVAAFAAYQAGEVDVAPVPPANRKEAMTVGSASNAELLRKADLTTFALMFNTKEKPWDNAQVRQAFATGIDRKAFIDGVQQGAGLTATGWLPPGMPGYDAAIGKQYEFDAAKARQLLSDAGYPNGDGLPKVTLFLRSNDANKISAQFIQEQYRRNLGVDVEVELVDSATYQSRFGKGLFSFSLGAWGADWPYPDNWLPEHFGSNGNFNIYGYSNPRVDDLLQKAAAETDSKQQLDLYGQAHKTVIDDAVLAPLYNRETFLVVNPRVRDLLITGLDAAIRGDWNLWKTWIAKS